MPRIEVDVPKAQFHEWVRRAQRAQTSVNRLIQQALEGVGRKKNPCGPSSKKNPAAKDETLVAFATDHNGRRLATITGGPGATVRSMIARIDAAHPNSRSAEIRGEYTSDGTKHGPGKGRVLASREPRTLADGQFYSGWIIDNPGGRRRRNDFTPAMSPALARKQRKQLDRDIRAHHKRANLDKLARLRHEITAARQSSKRLRGEAVSLCKIGRTMAKERAKQIRIEGRQRIRDEIQDEKLAARGACDARKVKIREDVKDAVARARAELKEEKRYQREIKRIESHAKKQARPKSTAAERRGESDDTVRDNIPADLVPLFEQVKRQIKGSDRETRTESFLRYAEENPGEVAAAIGREAEREIARLQREEAKEVRALRRRGVSAAELAAIPF